MDETNETLNSYLRTNKDLEEFKKRKEESFSAQELSIKLQRNNISAEIIGDLAPKILEKQVERVKLGLSSFEKSLILHEINRTIITEQVGWNICDIITSPRDASDSNLSVYLCQSGKLGITLKKDASTVIGYVDLRPLKLSDREISNCAYHDISKYPNTQSYAAYNHLYPEKLYDICKNIIAIAYAYKIDTTEYEKRLLSAYQPR